MSEALYLNLEGFEGPLDLLLDLARKQKVDLQTISILQLAEQYLSVINHAKEKAETFRWELAADWLVMAAWLAWLKSRLLLSSSDTNDVVEDAVDQLQERLIELEVMYRSVQWLEAQPRLHKDVFERPIAENHMIIDRSVLSGDVPSLALAYLGVRKRGNKRRSYTPRVKRYWTIQQAREALARLIGVQSASGWHSLDILLPSHVDGGEIGRRAARAGALMAGLEMARGGKLELQQESCFGDIRWREKG